MSEELRRDPQGAKGLAQWRIITIVSMILAMSIGALGFTLRMMGYARTVEWPFFFVSVVLLLLWRPHLDDGTGSPNPFSSQEGVRS